METARGRIAASVSLATYQHTLACMVFSPHKSVCADVEYREILVLIGIIYECNLLTARGKTLCGKLTLFNTPSDKCSPIAALLTIHRWGHLILGIGWIGTVEDVSVRNMVVDSRKTRLAIASLGSVNNHSLAADMVCMEV